MGSDLSQAKKGNTYKFQIFYCLIKQIISHNDERRSCWSWKSCKKGVASQPLTFLSLGLILHLTGVSSIEC